MYIEPNSNIKIYHNVPLDNSFNHTLWFDDLATQNAYFHGNTSILKYNLTSQSYQRVVRGKMRIEVKADDLYACNYLAFQNTSFGTKWFYAFITSVEYVNNVTSEINFEIDVMQTYLFDVQLRDCYVEREHSYTDSPGDNIVSENIDIGDITCYTTVSTDYFDDYSAVICTAYSSEGKTGGVRAGLFSGVNYVAGKVNTSTEVQQLVDFLDSAVQANVEDSIVSITLMPTAFYSTNEVMNVETFSIDRNNSIHTYVPKNKKLLTYPYNYLSVECGNNNAVYRYEWFTNEHCNFAMYGTVTCNPQIALVPFNYNGTENDHLNWNEQLVMEDFPQVAWSIDSYKAWLAQEASNTVLQTLSSTASIGIGMASGNAVATVGGIFGLSSAIEGSILAANRPNQARGASSGTVDVASRSKNFYFRRMEVSEQYAKIIDEYFNVYGYATRRVKVPNRSSRPYWNYVKTVGCVLDGNAPCDDLNKICSIYDNGITFWKNPDLVGQYSYDNSPTATA